MMKRRTPHVAIALLALLTGCGATQPDQRSAGAAPPRNPQLPPAALPMGPEVAAEAAGAATLTLADAVALALANNPDLAAAAWSAQAGAGRVLQAGLRQNPQVGLTVEDVAGTGRRSGAQQAETTLSFGQPIELGGQRSARVNEASRSRDLSVWDYQQSRLEVVGETSRAFVAVLGAQQRIALAEQTVRLGEEMLNSVGRLVNAGREPSAEATRAELALAAMRIDRMQAQRDLDTARHGLAALWGGPPEFHVAQGYLEDPRKLPSIGEFREFLPRNPDLQRWTSELAQRQAAVELAEANAIPNLTVAAGYRRFEDGSDSGFVFGASVPLPLLNRNQGAIEEARHQLAAAKEMQRAAELRARTALAQAHTALASAYGEIGALRQTILPAAQRAFESVNAGYLEGRYRYLDVLDAQRTLITNRERLLRAMTDYRQILVRVERLTGGPRDLESVVEVTGEPPAAIKRPSNELEPGIRR